MTTDVHPDEVLKAILDKGNRRDKEEKLRMSCAHWNTAGTARAPAT